MRYRIIRLLTGLVASQRQHARRRAGCPGRGHGRWSTGSTWRRATKGNSKGAPKAARSASPARLRVTASGVLVHPPHATATGHRGHLLLLLLLHHHALGGEEQSRDGRGVLQRRAGDLGGVDDAGRDQILVLVGLGVVAEVELGRLLHLPDDDRALGTGVLNDDPDRLLERAADDLDAGLLVVIAAPNLVERLLAPQERHAAARHDALLDRSAGGMQRVLDPGLLLLHFGLGGGPHVDNKDAARQLREPLLQFLLVVIRRGLLDRRLDLADAALDVGLLALAPDDRGVVLVDEDPLRVAEIVEHRVVELYAQLLGNHLAAGKDRDIGEQLLAPVPEAWGLHRAHLQRAAQLVDHQCGQRLALQVLGNDEQRLARLRHLLEQREQVLHRGDLFVVHQAVCVLEHGLHLLRIGNEVERQVAAVELHHVHRLERGLEALRLLDRDHAVLADLVHGVGDLVADLLITIGGDGADLRDLLPALGGRGDPLQLLHHQLDRLVDAALQRHRVGARGDRLQAFAEDRLRQNRRGGRAVPGDIRGLGRHFLHHLGAYVLDLVFELDLLRDGYPVLGNRRAPELFVDDAVATLRTEGDLPRLRQLVHTSLESRAGLCIEFEVLGSHLFRPRSAELRDDVGFLDQDDLFLLQLDLRAGVLPVHDPVADLQLHRDPLALFHAAGPDRNDLTLDRLLLGRVRDVQAPLHLLGLLHRPDRHPIGQREDLQFRLRRGSHDVLPPPEVSGRPRLPPASPPSSSEQA